MSQQVETPPTPNIANSPTALPGSIDPNSRGRQRKKKLAIRVDYIAVYVTKKLNTFLPPSFLAVCLSIAPSKVPGASSEKNISSVVTSSVQQRNWGWGQPKRGGGETNCFLCASSANEVETEKGQKRSKRERDGPTLSFIPFHPNKSKRTRTKDVSLSCMKRRHQQTKSVSRKRRN